MNEINTKAVMKDFYADCLAHHVREGRSAAEARKLALKDVEGIRTNPFSPSGAPLHEEARLATIEELKAEGSEER